MTMTDTEAKALALVNEIEVERYFVERMQEIRRNAFTLDEALCRAIERLEATEARHAAELREQAERFSEVAVRVKRFIEEAKLSRLVYDCSDGSKPSFIVDALDPFILPAPDPLVEVLKEADAPSLGDDGYEAMAARHAAELRELKERFSEATSLTLRMLTPYPLARDEAEDILIPFILPKPDPMVEVIADVRPWDTNHQWNNAAFSKRLTAAIEAHGGRVVWGDDQ